MLCEGFLKKTSKVGILLCTLLMPVISFASIKVGVGQRDITPPTGTPSAGCFERKEGMRGIHDPLLAVAMVIDNGEKLIAFCSVDHMGFLHEMTEEVKRQVHSRPFLAKCEIFIGASHTHSGGGGYLNLPGLGELIAGPYDPNLVKLCVEGAANAIIQAGENLQPAKIGVGYGQVRGLTTYGGVYPKELDPPTDLTVIKATKLDGSPLAVFFNYSLYPDILVYASDEIPATDSETMMVFSADVVGYTRTHVKSLIGNNVTPVFFNGSKGELLAKVLFPNDRFKSCDVIGKTLADGVSTAWNSIHVKDKMEISTFKQTYTFEPKATPSGFVLPVEKYSTEINLIVLDQADAFITIPAELSCALDPVLKEQAKKKGFRQLSILDIVNDAHGYVYSPESWRLGPDEVEFSWGGEMYGQTMENMIFNLLESASPNRNFKQILKIEGS